MLKSGVVKTHEVIIRQIKFRQMSNQIIKEADRQYVRELEHKDYKDNELGRV